MKDTQDRNLTYKIQITQDTHNNKKNTKIILRKNINPLSTTVFKKIQKKKLLLKIKRKFFFYYLFRKIGKCI